MVILDRFVELREHSLFSLFHMQLVVLLFKLLYDVEEVAELVKLMLAHGRSQVDHKSDRNHAETILMQILTQFGHALNKLVLCSDQSMILKVIDKILLAMLAQEIELDLAR